MKIAILNPGLGGCSTPTRGSMAVWAHEVAYRLARSCEVIVYVGGERIPWKKKEEWCDGVHYQLRAMGPDIWLYLILKRLRLFRNVKRPLFASRWYFPGYISQVTRDLRDKQCDIVHIHNFSQFVPVIRAFNPNIKIVLHMHCEWLTQLDRAMIEQRLEGVDLIIGCSEYITGKIRHAFPRFATHCQTVYNGVDVNQFVSENGRSAIRKNGTKRLLFVGRVSPEKGVHVLLEAFKEVVEHHAHAQLEIVGRKGRLPFEFIVALSDDDKVSNLASFYDRISPFSYFSDLQKQIDSSNITEQVTFSGSMPHPDVIDRYREADVFILPSVCNEAFGMPLIEAMACQVPVVATRSGGMPEIVEEGKTGLLVERADAKALAKAILRLLADQALCESMGKVGQQRVLELFSWEHVSENLLCQYKKILEDKLPSSA
jgi:glycosyltransferase involved in cell wall biosynthesis